MQESDSTAGLELDKLELEVEKLQLEILRLRQDYRWHGLKVSLSIAVAVAATATLISRLLGAF